MHNEMKKVLRAYFNEDEWNYHHSLAAVYWMEQLIKGEGGNPRILIPTMYLHDIGYAIAKKGKNLGLDERRNLKKEHMELGKRDSRKILPPLGFKLYEVDRIAHLIGVHDMFWELVDKDEKMVFEADTLGQIDVERVNPSYDREDWLKYLKTSIDGGRGSSFRSRASFFETETGKSLLNELLPKARDYSFL